MSPRIDSYLTLCLHEAAKSPLHYRHGCIIVRGGKVIGQGYNDYRRGFDGGSLKTGRLASAGALNAVLALKQKKASKAKVEHERLAHSVGGGRLANTPLSMHSEMMAIHSALSLSSTLSSSGSGRAASLLQKPYSKLQGRGKRQLRLRGLEAYVNFVCGQEQAAGEGIVAHGKVESTKQHGGASPVQESRFETSASQRSQGEEGGQRAEGRGKEGAGAPEGQCRERPEEEAVWESSQYFMSSATPLSSSWRRSIAAAATRTAKRTTAAYT